MFFIIFFTIYLLGNVYIIYRIMHDLKLHGIALTIFITFYLAITFLSVYSFKISRFNNPTMSAKILTEVGYVWLGTFSIALTYLLISHLAFVFGHTPKFRYNTTLITVILILVSVVYSYINNLGDPKVKEINIVVPNLPVEKLSIVQLSDIHIDVTTNYNTVKRFVEITNSLNPDVIMFTGDLADTDITKTYEKYGLLDLKSKYGIFAVSGNHEYYRGITNYEYICEKINFKLLNNENILVDDKFYVAGITDFKTSQVFNYKPADVKKSLQGIDFSKPVIFLSHQPNPFFESQKYPITIQLSGHTHAGQIPPFDIIEYFLYKYFWGLYKDSDSYIYVTSGTRLWGPPMRLFSKSEIVKINLVKN
ncbi:MAG: metallophosphoesterase [Elusimicrobia bacterium]|nr:metallophosphoesterase [Elusimicrobiota bacterium]